MTQNLFMPIDWQQDNAQEEYDRRAQMNAQVDFMNQLAQKNAGNKYIQDALLQQYMGMAFPEQEDPMQKLEMGLGFMQSDIPALQQAGQDILSTNPLTSQYFQGVDMEQVGQPADPFREFLGRADEMSIGDRSSAFDSFINSATDPLQQNDYKKLKDYYTNWRSGGLSTSIPVISDISMNIADPVSRALGVSDQGRRSDYNMRYRRDNAEEYAPYLERYGIKL